MHIWTDEPQKELWRQLRYLASPSNVYAILTGKTASHRDVKFDEGEETRLRAYEIASCVRQADEYQIASSDVGLVTRPLLDFYSCQALSKAVILASEKDVRLNDINFHGLSTRASSVIDESERDKFLMYSADKSMWSIEAEFAVTNDGVFKHLSTIFNDCLVSNGSCLMFDDILRNTPELADMYKRHYGKTSSSFYLSVAPSLDRLGKLKLLFSRDVDLDDVASVFPELLEGFEKIDRNNGLISNVTFENMPDWVRCQNGAIAGMFLTRGLVCGINKSASILFAGLFVLSNVVRYKPDFWMKEVEGERSGSASIVEAFCTLARRKLPKVLLKKFWKEVFTFGSPGYLT